MACHRLILQNSLKAEESAWPIRFDIEKTSGKGVMTSKEMGSSVPPPPQKSARGAAFEMVLLAGGSFDPSGCLQFLEGRQVHFLPERLGKEILGATSPAFYGDGFDR
jgi:hypothetical protein